jgi:hypothetical protein
MTVALPFSMRIALTGQLRTHRQQSWHSFFSVKMGCCLFIVRPLSRSVD